MGRSRDTADVVESKNQCTAWCVFDGTLTGTNPPIDGYNVVSVTRVSAGVYTVTFEAPMINTTFSVDVTTHIIAGTAYGWSGINSNNTTVNSAEVHVTGAAGVGYDRAYISVQVFGGK